MHPLLPQWGGNENGSGNAGGDRESMDPTSSSMMEDDADDNADPKDASTKKND